MLLGIIVKLLLPKHSIMRFINTKVHGVIDYLFNLFLIASPWIFGYHKAESAAEWVSIIIGATSLVISACTNYEFGLFKLINMRMHLLLDAFFGVVLALSPWIFAFYDVVYKPHLYMGVVAMAITFFSGWYPYARNAQVAKARESVEEDKIQSKAG